MIDESHSDFYSSQIDRYWRQLGRLFKSSDKILPRYLDTGQAAKVREKTYAGFSRVLSELPYIGGQENALTFTLVSSGAALAYLRVLEEHGIAGDAAGKLLNEVYADLFGSLPRFVKWWLRRSEFSARHQNKLRAYARRSQLRQYPGDWVMEYVEGDGRAFDFGCDYTECAVLKLYRREGAEKFMPYLCVMDFTMSRALRTGLRRSTTLCFGGKCCDFRYEKNQLGTPALPIENLPEYRSAAER